MGGWNNHPLRTEEGLSPEQLWTLGHFQDLDEGERLEVNDKIHETNCIKIYC